MNPSTEKSAAQIEAGFAQRDFTPEPGLELLGQFRRRVAESARDPLMAIAVALRQGELSIVLVTLDIAVLSESFIRDCQREFASRHNLPGTSLLIHSQHTHAAPGLAWNPGAATSPEFVVRVKEKLLEVVAAALDDLTPVELYAGCGQMEYLGWNRRAKFKDGTARMYGHSEMPGFLEAEGPRDPELPVLFARDGSGKIKGVLVNCASHPTSIERSLRYSADFPGEARRIIGAALGNVPVVYITGASGNTTPNIIDPKTWPQPWAEEEGLVRSGIYLAGIALATIAGILKPMVNPRLDLRQTVLSIPLRPWPAVGAPNYPPVDSDVIGSAYRQAEKEWPLRMAEQKVDPVRLNVVRIGDVVICTNPAELFVEFGLEIKKCSDAKITFIAELTDGYAGYIPTRLAYAGGGYETWPIIPSSYLDISAGDRIVEATKEMLALVASSDSV